MAASNLRTIDVPRSALRSVEIVDLEAHRARRRALDAMRALAAVGETVSCRVVSAEGAILPPDEVSEQDLAEIRSDLGHLATRRPLPLEALLEELYRASSYTDRSRVAPALDHLLEHVAYWSELAPERLSALFDQLDPSRLVRAVGQTLLAATRRLGSGSHARAAFLSRFFDDLRARGTPEATVDRLRRGLEG